MSLPRSFGPYTLLRRLAVGGMAEIYVSKTRGLGGFEKLTALKLVHPHLSADPQFVRMLIDEAKILVLLTHANIAQVFDLGCIDGRYFIAMEYVDGVDMHGLERAAARLGRQLSIPFCCFVVAELLNGLDYAHRKRDQNGRPLGIVHRDISPQNVVVSRAGEVKLVDFGIAKTNFRSGSTEVGVIKGKYGYMSPEQAWADPTDRRSDVFSAGVMLYELLTGSALYSAKSVSELIVKVRKAEIVPPNRQRPEIPEELSEIVMKALALEPSDRHQSALEMGDALREFLYRSSQALSGARLGRYVVEVLEADAKLTAENSEKSADETGGMRALTRDEFVRNDNSVIFSASELAAATRSEALPARQRARELGKRVLARILASESAPKPAVGAPPKLQPYSRPAEGGSGEQRLAAEQAGEDLSELWTARWFAQRGAALDVAPEIRVQGSRAPAGGDDGGPTRELNSLAPPTLSWPPLEPLRASSGPGAEKLGAPALVPPRGNDPSLGPLPRLPAAPSLRRISARRPGRRELWRLLLLVLVAALAVLIAWESTLVSVIEIVSVPSGAEVRINGALQPGTTPLRVSGLRPGVDYELRLDKQGYLPYEASFTAVRGTRRHNVPLAPVPEPPPH